MAVLKNSVFTVLIAILLQGCTATQVQNHHLESIGTSVADTELLALNTGSEDNATCCSENGGGKCVGKTNCTACSNCSRCAYCNSGGSCGVCAGGSYRSSSSPRSTYGRGLGQISFWTNIPLRGEIKIYIDGTYAGSLDSYFSKGTPRCGQEGTVTVSKSSGKHIFYAKSDSGREWRGTVNFGSSGCQTMSLTN